MQMNYEQSISNLKVFSSLLLGEKLISENFLVRKENRHYFLPLRRALEHAFDVQVIEDTLKMAEETCKDGKKPYLFSDYTNVTNQAKEVSGLIPTALVGINILSQTYLEDNNEITAQKIEEIYCKYNKLFDNELLILRNSTSNDQEMNKTFAQTEILQKKVHTTLKAMHKEKSCKNTLKNIRKRYEEKSRIKLFLRKSTKESLTLQEAVSSVKKELSDAHEKVYENFDQMQSRTKLHLQKEKEKNEVKKKFNMDMIKSIRKKLLGKQEIKPEGNQKEFKHEVAEDEWEEDIEIARERKAAVLEAQNTLKRSISVFTMRPNLFAEEKKFVDDHHVNKDDFFKNAIKSRRKGVGNYSSSEEEYSSDVEMK